MYRNPTFYSSFLVIIPFLISYRKLHFYHPIVNSYLLIFITSILHHSRPYKIIDKKWDFIRIIDVLTVFYNVNLTLFYHYNNLMVILTLLYDSIIFLFVIPNCSTDYRGCCFHSSIHIVTVISISMVNLTT